MGKNRIKKFFILNYSSEDERNLMAEIQKKNVGLNELIASSMLLESYTAGYTDAVKAIVTKFGKGNWYVDGNETGEEKEIVSENNFIDDSEFELEMKKWLKEFFEVVLASKEFQEDYKLAAMFIYFLVKGGGLEKIFPEYCRFLKSLEENSDDGDPTNEDREN